MGKKKAFQTGRLLTKSELERFYEYIFFSKIRVLLLENKVDESYYKYEQKNTVDQHFLEL